MSKRARTSKTNTGGSYRTSLPFAEDSLNQFRAREEGLRSIRNKTSTFSVVQLVDNTHEEWKRATHWEPADRTDFALDPNGDWYDEECGRDIVTAPPDPPLNTKKGAKKRSKVSARPHVVWKENYRTSYLDEICRLSGRGDFRHISLCPDCVASKKDDPGKAEYRCISDCLLSDMTCQGCCVRRHKRHPFHRIEKWNGLYFDKVSLQSLGLVIQLNHAGGACSYSSKSHQDMVVLHTNGFHNVTFHYCGCSRGEPQHIQLLRRRLYPASQLVIKTCATFDLLTLLHTLALTTKAATYDFYRTLEKLTDHSGLSTPTYRYRSLFRMVLQWRHLMMLKWAGRAHDPSGPEGTKPGELGIRCPSCPLPGINLPDDWEKTPPAQRFLYMMIICLDANFRLKNRMVSNWSQDPGLGVGLAYMLAREEYEAYVDSRANEGDASSCVGFQAIIQANTRFSKGLRYTGVGGAFCGRSEMIFPQGIGNLKKGERYSNMDFIFASAAHQFTSLAIILVSYDICCQWFVNLFSRMSQHWPDNLRIPSTTTLIPAIPKLHEPMHHAENHQQFSLNYIRGVGHTDGECPERGWGGHNDLGKATLTQGVGSRHDVLDDHFGFWNWQKFIGMGRTLLRRYRAAVADRNIQVEGHRGLSKSVGEELVQEWTELSRKWEEDSFPRKAKNPYEHEAPDASESDVKKELALEEEARLKAGGVALHQISAHAFISLGLEIEDSQRRLKGLAKDLVQQATALQEGGLIEQRNQLTSRIRQWEAVLPIYIPGLLQHLADRAQSGNSPMDVDVEELPEDHILWFPSRLSSSVRDKTCIEGLPSIEERMRTSQCYGALSHLRRILTLKARLTKFKNDQVRGQREGTRSRAIIDRVHERARAWAAKYRAARAAKFRLSGSGEWEMSLRILLDEDLRSRSDVKAPKQKQPRRGIFEDGQEPDPTETSLPQETESFTLLPEARSRESGTGETRNELSWIWMGAKAKTGLDKYDDEILRTEWCKSRARAERAKEEVLLLREEMRRVLAYLRWKSDWWKDQRRRRTLNSSLSEGLESYAWKRSNHLFHLALSFKTLWSDALQKDFNPMEELEVDRNIDNEEYSVDWDDSDTD